MSAVTQNAPPKIELNALKVHHFSDVKTSPIPWVDVLEMGDVQHSKSAIQNLIRDLSQRGWSERRIAHQLQLNRRTVRRYAQKQVSEDVDESPFLQTESEAKCTTNSTTGSGVPPDARRRPTKPGRKSQCEPFAETIAGKIV